ncbi:MAG: Hsp20/alpha crystallin family protein [Curvibacter sp.]|nr:Hsp20/alpha crystallin family protein [Curvibacter sp.]
MIFAPVIRPAAFRPNLRAMDRNLERFLHQTLWSQPDAACRPGSKVEQDDKSYTLQLDVPGLGRDQLQVDIDAHTVRIESSAEAPRRYQSAFELPQEIDAAQSSAQLANGVLTLKLVKKVASPQATRLNIQ